jgi:NADPH2:quinone reductase
MLKRAGAVVIGTTSSSEKEELARKVGADHIIRYDQHDFTEEARRLTDGRGVDIVYDSVGKDTFDGSLRALRPRGLCALFGQSSGPVPPFDLRRLNDLGSLFVTRPSLAHYTAERSELEQRAGSWRRPPTPTAPSKVAPAAASCCCFPRPLRETGCPGVPRTDVRRA